ncbi:MAG: pilus assembly protein [Methylococcales bacterium]|jgi:hypothetical protein|nr:pilus assembly protein [Methylococcales bacterium]MBT7409594.1 pilus assembly protein [Methylococcales bacterium]
MSIKKRKLDLNRHQKSKMTGAAMAEMVIITPVALILIMGVIQTALIYQAKATLNYAALMAARGGSARNADYESIKIGLQKGILPLYSPPKLIDTVVGFGKAAIEAGVDVGIGNGANNNPLPSMATRITILNPTKEAFDDFGVMINGQRQIPNSRLHLRGTGVGALSGVSIQDANLLKVKIEYCYSLKVPFVDSVITTAATLVATDGTGWTQTCLGFNRIPIVATSMVRMQTPIIENEWIQKRDDVEKQLADAL